MANKADNGTLTRVREPFGGSTVKERKEASPPRSARRATSSPARTRPASRIA